MLRSICFTLLLFVFVSDASAVLSAYFDEVINDSAPSLEGYYIQDLRIDTSDGDDWGTAQLLVSLDNYQPDIIDIYQDPNGSDTPPNPLLFDTFPELKYDTYLDGNGQQPNIFGEAVDLGGDAKEFSTSHIDVLWLNTKQDDFGDFSIGRFTLSDQAAGSWAIMVTSTSGFRTYQGRIHNGQFDLLAGPPDGDLDSDGFVGITDLNIILGNWNKTIFTGDSIQIGDLNFDGFVGIEDLNTILTNWNMNVGPGDEALGDINGDLLVGIEDLNVVLSNWNFQIPDVDLRADTNFDNFIGIEDLNLVLSNWNDGTPPPSLDAILTPEPSSAIAFLSLVGLGLRRRYR